MKILEEKERGRDFGRVWIGAKLSLLYKTLQLVSSSDKVIKLEATIPAAHGQYTTRALSV